jgi:hypothetical protein
LEPEAARTIRGDSFVAETNIHFPTANAEAPAVAQETETFLKRTRQVCGTARRRVLCGETIPHGEKLFSIFERLTQMYNRGKAGQPMQFGRLVLVYEDGAGFITHYFILPRDKSDRDALFLPLFHGQHVPPALRHQILAPLSAPTRPRKTERVPFFGRTLSLRKWHWGLRPEKSPGRVADGS